MQVTGALRPTQKVTRSSESNPFIAWQICRGRDMDALHLLQLAVTLISLIPIMRPDIFFFPGVG